MPGMPNMFGCKAADRLRGICFSFIRFHFGWSLYCSDA